MSDVIKQIQLAFTQEEWDQLKDEADIRDYDVVGWIQELVSRSLE